MDGPRGRAGGGTMSIAKSIESEVRDRPDARSDASIAAVLQPVVHAVLGPQLPVRLQFWDGSELKPSGARAAGTLLIRSPDAIRRIVWAPNSLGLGRAFVAGDLDADGDLCEVIGALRDVVPDDLRVGTRGGTGGRASHSPARAARPAAATAAEEARLRGLAALAASRRRRHRPPLRRRQRLLPARARALDDVLVRPLRRRRARPHRRPGRQARADLPQARPRPNDPADDCSTSAAAGARWRSTPRRTTTSPSSASPSARRRRRWPASAWRDAGVADRVEIRLQDYRELGGERFDAISSIGMSEHVGQAAARRATSRSSTARCSRRVAC